MSTALGQLTAMLFKIIISIGYKQGISVDPLMWPIPQVMWEELLVPSPIYISLDFCDFLELCREGGKGRVGET